MSWSSAPTADTPVRQGAWSSSPAVTTQEGFGAWLSSLEKVAQFTGSGSLTAAAGPKRTGLSVGFSGQGSYSAALIPKPSIAAGFGGDGFNVTFLSETRGTATSFTSSGELSAIINDGLTAIIGSSYLAQFSGGGGLGCDVDSSERVYDDGLTADVFGRIPTTVLLSGLGELSALVGDQHPAAVDFTGSGTLGVAAGAAFSPTDLTNCTVWLDASTLGLADGASIGSSWPDLSGSGHHGAVVSSPSPKMRTGALNGLPVVKFTANEGRIRGTGMCTDGTWDLSVFYIGRMWGGNVGRIFSNVYPPYNFLIGTHTVGEPVMYDNGWTGGGPGWTIPSTWKLYEGICSATPRVSELFVNGVSQGTTGSSAGHDNRWNLSGYEDTGAAETCDCEVAELICYDRTVTSTERAQIENYLSYKWLGTGTPPSGGAGLKQIYPTLLNLAGTGQISTTAIQVYTILAALLSSGATSADMLRKHLTDIGFDGSSLLEALFSPHYTQSTAVGGDGTFAPAVTQKYTFSLGLGGDGALTFDATAAGIMLAPYAGAGALTATGIASYARTLDLAGSGTLTATGTAKYSRTADLNGAGTLTATATAKYTGTAALTGTGALSVTTTAIIPTALNLTGAGTLSAAVYGIVPSSAALNGAGTLSATVTGQHQLFDGLLAVLYPIGGGH